MNETEGYVGQEKKSFENNEFWQQIYAAYQNDQIIQRKVTAIEDHETAEGNSPCLIITWGDQIKGLIPASESGLQGTSIAIIRNKMRKIVGKNVVFKVKGIDRENNLCVLSRKEAVEQMAAKTWKQINVGDKVSATVREVAPTFVKVNIGGIDSFIHASQLSHGWVSDVRNYFSVGDTFDVLVKDMDKEKKTLSLSLKDLLVNPWDTVGERYSVEGEYLGRVVSVVEYGVFINLETGVDALVALPKSELTRDMCVKGAEALIRISNLDIGKKRIYGRIIRVNR